MHLNDLWKEKYVNLNGYTWCGANNIPKKPHRLHIYELIFVDKNKTNLCRIPGTQNNGTRMSDHRTKKFDFSICDNEKGKRYWKLNTSLLECNEYKRQVRKMITDISKKEGFSIDKWESLKLSIKDFSIAFSIKRQKTY